MGYFWNFGLPFLILMLGGIFLERQLNRIEKKLEEISKKLEDAKLDARPDEYNEAYERDSLIRPIRRTTGLMGG